MSYVSVGSFSNTCITAWSQVSVIAMFVGKGVGTYLLNCRTGSRLAATRADVDSCHTIEIEADVSRSTHVRLKGGCFVYLQIHRELEVGRCRV